MLVLDENLPADQQQLLRKWRIPFRFVGADVATSGAQDENLIPVLHGLSHPTFFTLDRHFFRRDWAHATIVWSGWKYEAATQQSRSADFFVILLSILRRNEWASSRGCMRAE